MKGSSINTHMGNITINTDVIAQYAGSVAVECFGIVGMAGISMKDGIVRLLKKDSLTRGIEVNIENNKLILDFHVIVAYGVTARICKSAITELRKAGIKAGLLRPITLWPFPKKILGELAEKTKAFISVEMSMGQMVDDVRLAVNGKKPVYFYGRTGGIIPSVEEVAAEIAKISESL